MKMTDHGNPNKETRLWTSNFVLLWQGQFVSSLGDVMYGMAMGFWILGITGSTALMGTLMMAGMLPAVLVSPFAGVIVDRADRKRLMILADLVRGVATVLIGVAAFRGVLEVWMVFAAGIALGFAGAFFTPTIGTLMPEIVHSSQLMRANSVFGMLQAGSNIAGSTLGGILFQLLGAPIMFLFNGLSFLFSGAMSAFLRIPRTERPKVEKHFIQDIKEGYLLVWKLRGLRFLLIILSFTSLVGSAGTILFIPLFQKTEGLGPVKAGVATAFMIAGSLLGMVLMSAIKMPEGQRTRAFIAGGAVSFVSFALFSLTRSFPGMLFLLLIGGAFGAVVPVYTRTTIQLAVPKEMLGKVFSLVGVVTQGLMPLGMALGGVLGQYFPLRAVMASAFLAELIVFMTIAFIPSFQRFMNANHATPSVAG